MGTWDDSLYDNDAALETLDDLAFSIDLELSPAHLAAGIGLIAWLLPSSLDSEEVEEALDANRAWIEAMPPAARERLAALEADPVAFVKQRHSRSPELRALLGPYEDGPREDALLQVPGGELALEEFAEECRSRLDQGAEDWPDLDTLIGEIAVLGPLAELRALKLTTPRERVEGWHRAFRRAAASRREGREKWNGFVTNVEKIFLLLES